MNRLLATLWLDVRLQVRHRIYAISVPLALRNRHALVKWPARISCLVALVLAVGAARRGRPVRRPR